VLAASAPGAITGSRASQARLQDHFRWVDEQLARKAYTMGDGFSVADAYCSSSRAGASTSASTCRATRTGRPSWAAWPRERRCRKR
jgi:glutathione S-transferase